MEAIGFRQERLEVTLWNTWLSLSFVDFRGKGKHREKSEFKEKTKAEAILLLDFESYLFYSLFCRYHSEITFHLF